MNKNITKLKDIILKQKGENNKQGDDFFEPIGLILVNSDSFDKYDTDFNDSEVFATTGGDGVHFSFLGNQVVLSVPRSNIPNIVLAKNFEDFMGIGTKYGFSYLENFAYNFHDTVKSYYNKGEEGLHELFENEIKLLNILKEEFKINSHIEDIETYLKQLNKDIEFK